MQTKGLLAELAMVEDEIARLEGQISRLQNSLKHEQEGSKDSQSKQWRHGSLSNLLHHSSVATHEPSPINKGGNEMIAYETKALHFISKAIKGDYNLNNFSLAERLGNSRFDDQKENHFQDAAKFQDKVPRKSGFLKPASPLRDPRHPSPKVNLSPVNFIDFLH